MNTFLDEHNIGIPLSLFALHTVGLIIVEGIQKCLNLRAEQVFATWYFIKKIMTV